VCIFVAKMEKDDIQKLIRTKSARVTFEANSGKITSEVWQRFVRVKVDSTLSDFVKCQKCDTVLKWKSRDGTHGLKMHMDSCSSKTSLRKIDDMAGFACAKQPHISAAVKSDLTAGIVRMCAVDIRPFSVIEGEGFKHLADKLIQIGAKYGPVPASDLLPCATTVSRHLADIVATEKDKVMDFFTCGNCRLTGF
jgi:hypothetical protein